MFQQCFIKAVRVIFVGGCDESVGLFSVSLSRVAIYVSVCQLYVCVCVRAKSVDSVDLTTKCVGLR